MKINVTKKEKIEVEISDDEVVKITLKQIQKVCNYPKTWFIENGFICEEVEHITSHKFYETVKIREATEFDKHVYDLIQLILINEYIVNKIKPMGKGNKK